MSMFSILVLILLLILVLILFDKKKKKENRLKQIKEIDNEIKYEENFKKEIYLKINELNKLSKKIEKNI
jgi:sensor domain CHASE-containing protein